MQLLKRIGPGLLFAGAAIGVSHLVQSTRAGADFGFGLLWALLLIHLFKYPFFQYGPRYAMATGESLLQGYLKLGKAFLLAYFILTMATMFTIQTAVTIVTAGLAANLFGLTADPVIWSIIITVICTAILLFGHYKLLDRLMKYIVLILTLCTLSAVIIALTNSNPPELDQVFPTEGAALAFLIAFMGWMPAPMDISVWHSLWSIEKQQIAPEYDADKALNDFNLGYASTIILGVFFISLGALVMYDSGNSFSAGAGAFASEFINLYTSSLGENTFLIIALAGFTAMVSTTLTTLDASPRTMAQATQLITGKKTIFNFTFWIVILALGTIGILLFFLSEMKTLIDVATILSFLTAPFYAALNFRLITSKHTPEAQRPGKFMVVLSWSGIVFLCAFSLWYITTL
ncbi:divalent metal cation transporter [Robertkochia marina]|uniref:Divalent metal cation transporter n=1 Tax=Robertkochia marina TaxID=1227945 RepID=A0A4S3LY45_9FLAO|nr:Nramp family divalent metal transporter [Robertkochia marina]THD66356.1 divalent metal cation transporter [Robertkochia marina]TRZ44037.1 divalent metal cation transporter [Robertkochia marina]